MDFNNEHATQIDFHFDKSIEISQSKTLCKNVLAKLTMDLKIIDRSTFVSEEVRREDNTIIFTYILDAFKPFTLQLEILLDKRDVRMIRIKSRFDGQLLLRCSCLSNLEVVAGKLHSKIVSHKLGFGNEEVFDRDFLVRIKQENLPEIVYAHRASTNADTKRGIDFVVGFKPVEQDNVFQIEFNLKLSEFFLQKHKQRYPKVSTFIFSAGDLSNYEDLKTRFVWFLKEALKKGVAHRNGKNTI